MNEWSLEKKVLPSASSAQDDQRRERGGEKAAEEEGKRRNGSANNPMRRRKSEGTGRWRRGTGRWSKWWRRGERWQEGWPGKRRMVKTEAKRHLSSGQRVRQQQHKAWWEKKQQKNKQINGDCTAQRSMEAVTAFHGSNRTAETKLFFLFLSLKYQ